MKNLNIINSLNILQKINFGENNSILFYFGDTPNWNDKNVIKDVTEPKNHYEVVQIFCEQELTDFYWKLHRHSGEEMFLQKEENKINIWEGEICDYEEYWGTFDDIEEIEYKEYKSFTIEKSAEDWKRDYENLRKRYYSLYKKKTLQLNEYRNALQDEFKNNIEIRVKSMENYGHTVDKRLLDQVFSALNDEHSGIKISSIVDFIYE